MLLSLQCTSPVPSLVCYLNPYKPAIAVQGCSPQRHSGGIIVHRSLITWHGARSQER